MTKPKPKCDVCRKHPMDWDGCSRVVCPKRKSYSAVLVPDAQITADALHYGLVQDKYAKIPTNKE